MDKAKYIVRHVGGLGLFVRAADEPSVNLIGPLTEGDADALAKQLKAGAREQRQIAEYQHVLRSRGLLP